MDLGTNGWGGDQEGGRHQGDYLAVAEVAMSWKSGDLYAWLALALPLGTCEILPEGCWAFFCRLSVLLSNLRFHSEHLDFKFSDSGIHKSKWGKVSVEMFRIFGCITCTGKGKMEDEEVELLRPWTRGQLLPPGRVGLDNINYLFIPIFMFSNYLAPYQVSHQAISDAGERAQRSGYEL